MTYSKRAEQIRAMAESLRADEGERDRLKQRADETLVRLHEAVREFVEGGHAAVDPFRAKTTAAGRAGR
jgi:hypothetical protein